MSAKFNVQLYFFYKMTGERIAESSRAEKKQEKRKEMATLNKNKAIRELEEKTAYKKLERKMDRKIMIEKLEIQLESSEEVIDSIAIGIGSVNQGINSSQEKIVTNTTTNDFLLMAMGSVTRECDVTMIASTYWAIKNLSEYREKMLEVRKRYVGLQVKAKRVQNLGDVANGEIRNITRAYTMIKHSPSLITDGFDPSKETSKLKEILEIKKSELNILNSLSEKIKEEVQLAMNCTEVEEEEVASQYQEVRVWIERMHSTELSSLQTINTIRLNLQEVEEKIRNCRSREALVKGRHKIIATEFKRITNRTTSHRRKCSTNAPVPIVSNGNYMGKINQNEIAIDGAYSTDNEFIDTDVYMGGYMQRCRVTEVIAHLSKELKRSSVQLIDLPIELEESQKKANEMRLTLRKERRICDRLFIALRIFEECLKAMTALSPDQSISQLNNLQLFAQEEEEKRGMDDKLNRVALELGTSSAIERIRLKNLAYHTKDEKLFMSLDLIIDPWAYSNLTPAEIEIMKNDILYRSDLTVADLERIDKLPPLISIALPFLLTSQEIEAHRLLNKYKRDLDDEVFLKKDRGEKIFVDSLYQIGSERKERKEDKSIDITNTASSSQLLTAELEARHEVLLIEGRR